MFLARFCFSFVSVLTIALCLAFNPTVLYFCFLFFYIFRKQCVKRYNSFDFLTEVVNKVPDLGGADSCGDERGLPRRR